MTSVFLPLAMIALLGVVLRQLIPSMEDNRRAMNQMVLVVIMVDTLLAFVTLPLVLALLPSMRIL